MCSKSFARGKSENIDFDDPYKGFQWFLLPKSDKNDDGDAQKRRLKVDGPFFRLYSHPGLLLGSVLEPQRPPGRLNSKHLEGKATTPFATFLALASTWSAKIDFQPLSRRLPRAFG